MATNARTTRGAQRKVTSEPTHTKVDTVKDWLARGFVSLSVLFVAFIGVKAGLYLTSLEVKRIEVKGNLENVSVAAVESRVGPEVGNGFLAADLDEIRAQLEEMPWVYQVNIRRRWPDTLEITVQEQRPIARWNDAGFLNHEGELFESAVSPDWARLPALDGPQGTEQELMQRYLRIESLVNSSGFEVVRLSQDAIGQYTAEFDNGMQLVIGNDHFVSRIRRFLKLYHTELKSFEVARVDLRYEHGAAVEFATEHLAMSGQMTQGGQ